jgi:hypothetical protein
MPFRRDSVLMRQLKVFRCEVCHVPFLFENNLQDHVMAAHAPRVDPEPTSVTKKKQKSRRKASAS